MYQGNALVVGIAIDLIIFADFKRPNENFSMEIPSRWFSDEKGRFSAECPFTNAGFSDFEKKKGRSRKNSDQ